MARMLRDAGYDVVLTTSVARAVKHLEAGVLFDIALVDVLMPEMLGTHFACGRKWPQHARR